MSDVTKDDRDRLFDALRNGKMTMEAIAARFGWTIRATRERIHRQEEAGKVFRVKHKGQIFWCLTVGERIKGNVVPSRKPPEFKPLNRDIYEKMKLAMLIRENHG